MSSFWSKAKNGTSNVLAIPTGGISLLAQEGMRDGLGDAWNNWSGTTAARAARKGAKAQENAANRAITETTRLHEQGRQDLMPWMQRGNEAGAMLSQLLAPGGMLSETYGGPYQAKPFEFNVDTDPGAQYRIDTANKALERSAAGKGRSMGGRAIRNVAELNQELGSQEYGKAYDRYTSDRAYGLGEDSYNRSAFNDDRTRLFNQLFGISGQGQSAAAGQASQNASFADAISQLFTGIGNTKAAGLVGAANAKQAGTTNIINPLGEGGVAALAAFL